MTTRYQVRVITEPTFEPIGLIEARDHLRLTATSPLPVGSPPVVLPPSHIDDTWIANVGLPAARDWCERYMGRSIGQKTLELAANAFPAALAFVPCRSLPYNNVLDGASDTKFTLPYGPVRSIVSITYTDPLGVGQIVPGYTLDDYSQPATLAPVFGEMWPVAQSSSNAVKIRYTVGYAMEAYGIDPDIDPTSPYRVTTDGIIRSVTDGTSLDGDVLPPSIRSAMLLVLGHLYENRENSTIGRATNIQEIPLGAENLLQPYVLRVSMA